MARPLIVDCDPGTDDAVALIMLSAAPEAFNLLGVTTVGGNVSLDLVTQNALKVLQLVGSSVGVYKGCSRPLVKTNIMEADYVHGSDGLGGVGLPASCRSEELKHGVDFIIDTVKSHPSPVTLLPIGPLTNIAMALVKDPSIKSNIAEIVFMGGAMRDGNVPGGYAEFNIFNDPHAAHVVMESGLKLTMIGLDVTHHAIMSEEYFQRLQEMNNPVSLFMHNMLSKIAKVENEHYGFKGCILHDPCAVAFLYNPSIFSGKECPLFVEIQSSSTMGQTVADWHNWQKRPTNVFVPHKVDRVAFLELVMELVARYS